MVVSCSAPTSPSSTAAFLSFDLRSPTALATPCMDASAPCRPSLAPARLGPPPATGTRLGSMCGSVKSVTISTTHTHAIAAYRPYRAGALRGATAPFGLSLPMMNARADVPRALAAVVPAARRDVASGKKGPRPLSRGSRSRAVALARESHGREKPVVCIARGDESTRKKKKSFFSFAAVSRADYPKNASRASEGIVRHTTVITRRHHHDTSYVS